MVAAVAPAHALDPALSIEKYKHTRWTIDDGVPSNIVDLAQSADGYLWLASSDGLFRFDGVTFEPIDPPNRSEPPGAMVAARDGSLWVAFEYRGVLQYKAGHFRDTGLPEMSVPVTFLTETRDGAVWAGLGRPRDALARYANGRWDIIGTDGGLPEGFIMALLPTRDGSLWVATLDKLVVLRPGARRFTPTGIAIRGHAALAEDAGGHVWLSDSTGSRPISPNPLPPSATYSTPSVERVPQTLFDRDGNLWGISTTKGIFRLTSPNAATYSGRERAAAAVTTYGAQQGLSSDLTSAILEDREGNIWVASSLGLDRFRSSAFVPEPILAVPTNGGAALGYDRRGAVYVGDDTGLAVVEPTGAARRLRAGNVFAFCQDSDGSLWSAVDRDFLHFMDGRTEHVALPPLKHGLIFECAIDRHGVTWLAAGRDGIFRRDHGGSWQPVSIPSEFAALTIDNVEIDTNERPLFNVYGGPLLEMGNDGVVRSVATSEAPMPRVYAMYRSSLGTLLGTNAGLGRLREGGLDWIGAKVAPALANVHGMYQAGSGEVWLFGRAGVVRVKTVDLRRAFESPARGLPLRLFDLRDGLPNIVPKSIRHAIVPGARGRLWFATRAGVVWLDPAKLPINRIPPPVTIRQVIVRSVRYRDPTALKLPAGSSSFQIDYTAPSLTIPERVRFRYRLEGVDPDWVDAGARRQAFYTNVKPGHYVFSVIAANNDGVWSRSGARLALDVPPTFFQSAWFTLLCLIVVSAAIWALYSLRLRQVAGRMRSRLEARLAERERIARELHDTLLQGFQGLMLRFQSVAERMPADEPARPLLDQALDRADLVLADGRDRVRALRAAGHTSLADRIADIADEFATDHAGEFQVIVEGAPRTLHPLVLDEVAAIAREALRNAFRHAKASEIEVTLVYGRTNMRVGVRDDGVGIPSDVAEAGGRPDHFGLSGMRERAVRISAKLELLSRPGAGTEIVLTVPARVAYRDPDARQRRSKWWPGEPLTV